MVKDRLNRRTGIIKICPCGNSFYCEKGKMNRKKYCSVKCRCDYHPTGAKYSEQGKKNISDAKRGVSFSDTHKENLRKAHLGEKHTPERIENNRIAQLKRWDRVGRKNIEELQQYGDDNKDRRSSAYTEWRKRIWLRDNFTCKIANPDCAGRIEAHHILGWKDYPELRYEVNNGITLCHFHHPRKRNDEMRLSPYFKELVITK